MHSNVPCRSCGGVIPPARRSSAVYCSTPCGNRSRSAVYAARNPQKIKESRERQLSKTERRIHARLHRRANKDRSEEHTHELQSLIRISNAVFCLTKIPHYTS